MMPCANAMPIAVLAGLILAVAPSPVRAGVLLSESFDLNTSNFAGKSKFSNKYCKDSWTTSLNGGVMAKTDDGCSCAATGQSACDYAVYTARGNSCYKSEPVDNLLVAGDVSWADYELSVRLRNVDDDTLGVVFRYQNTANYYAVWLSRDVGPGVGAACDGSFPGARLVKFSAKSGAGKGVLLAASQTTYKIGQTHLLRVRVKGTSIVVHFDANADGVIDEVGELLFNTNDGTHAKGAVGLYAYQNGAAAGTSCAKGGCWFDDLKVTTIDPSVAPDAGGTGEDASPSPDAGGFDPPQDAGATAPDSTGGPDSAGPDMSDAVASSDLGVRHNGDAVSDAVADAPSALKDALSDGGAPLGPFDGPAQPLTLTVVGGADDGGCTAGHRGRPAAVWLALLAALSLAWRRSLAPLSA